MLEPDHARSTITAVGTRALLWVVAGQRKVIFHLSVFGKRLNDALGCELFFGGGHAPGKVNFLVRNGHVHTVIGQCGLIFERVLNLRLQLAGRDCIF